MTLEGGNSGINSIESLKKIAQKSGISIEKIDKINNFENPNEKQKYLEALIYVEGKLLSEKNSEDLKIKKNGKVISFKISEKEREKINSMDPINAQKYLFSIENRDIELILMFDRGLITAEQANYIKTLEPEIAEIEIYETKAREQLLFDLKKEEIITEEQADKYHEMSPKDAFDKLLPIIDKRNFEYTIKKDDTLWKIVKNKLGDNSTNKDIFLELKFIVDLNPNLNIDILKYRGDILEKGKDGIPGDILKEGQIIKLKANKEGIKNLTKKNIASLGNSFRIV